METWILKTADGESYNLQVAPTDDPTCYDGIYNLMDGVTGHHGMPVTLTSDQVPNIAGAELAQVQYGIREVYLPLYIRGNSPADFHHNLSKLRRSLNPNNDVQLWVTNEEGQTRVLYCRYSKGFDTFADDSNRQLSWGFVPLYVDALDPYWYDPPGSEIEKNFSSDPWTANFFTLTELMAVAQDASEGDTQIVVDNTINCAVGAKLEIRAAKFVLGTEGAEPEFSEEVKESLKATESIVQNTSISINTDNSNPQVNQIVHVSGTAVSVSGTNVSNSVCEVSMTTSNGVTTTHTVITNANGNYNFTWIPDIEDVFSFIVKLLADEVNFHTSTSPTLPITVGTTAATTLTLAVSPSNPAVNSTFTLSGTLKAKNVGVIGQKIALQRSTPMGMSNMGSATTDKNGAYSITVREPHGFLIQQVTQEILLPL